VQYDTDEQIAEDFFKSVDYQQYLAEGGRRFSKDVFLQAKCFCIEKSNFQECACPPCTLMRETTRGWHTQRKKWYSKQDKEGAAACSCGECAKGSAYREASGSLSKLRAFIHAPCGKVALPSLAIEAGPKAAETVKFYKRQCCRAPLPDSACHHQAKGSKGACSDCGNCSNCGWEATMPECPIEYSDEHDAEWKEYRPRVDPEGHSFRDELVTVKGTRKQLMERLQKLYLEWSPHDWINRWSAHQRHLTYATFGKHEMCISTDFSAQYDHKAFCTRTCEHPSRSNMDVFIVTHSPRDENGKRVVTTDVWRIFSEAKGSSQFHNQGLDHITQYYREKLGLHRIFVFSDGCRAQYKGKRNFLCIAKFPSRMNGVTLIHRFAASHHFKGPHDAYGKDAKVLCRTAERNEKARLASTHDVYYFCATMLPRPRRGVNAKQLVDPLPPQPAPPPRPVEQQAAEQEAAEGAMAEAVTAEAAAAIAARMEGEVGITPPDLDAPEAPDPAAVAADAAAAVEWDAEQEEDPEAAAMEAAQDTEAAAGFSPDLDAEPDEEGGCGDFEFDESGARIGAEHSETPATGAPVAVAPTTAVEDADLPRKRQRRARKVTILSQQPGMEASADCGESREVQWSRREPGMFSASNYFWLYYSSKPGLKEVPLGQLAAPGECHATLDEDANIDADSIPGSNSTYDFTGTSIDHPELLYTRTYACACRMCREPSSVSVEYTNCPNMTTVGRFVQQTIHGAVNIVKAQTDKRLQTADFARKIEPEHLYGAFASFQERGSRSYWLLRSLSTAEQAKNPIKVDGGTTIRTNQWVVKAQWYSSTSDDQGRKSYTLLPEIVYVPVKALVQESELEWRLEGRSASGGDSILTKESHLRLMSHNYSNLA
jgi:hypothetical protein